MEDRRGKNVVVDGGKSESDEQGTSSRTTLAGLFSQTHDQEDPADKKEDDKEGENQEERSTLAELFSREDDQEDPADKKEDDKEGENQEVCGTTLAELFSREDDQEDPADKKEDDKEGENQEVRGTTLAELLSQPHDQEDPADKKEDDSSSSSRKQEPVSIAEKRKESACLGKLLRAHLEPKLKLLRDCEDEVKDLEKDIEALQQCYEMGGDENSLIKRISSSEFKELSANLNAKLQALKNSIDKKKELEEDYKVLYGCFDIGENALAPSLFVEKIERIPDIIDLHNEEIKELTEQVEFGCNLIVQHYAGINQQEMIPAEGEAAADNPGALEEAVNIDKSVFFNKFEDDFDDDDIN